MKKQFIILTVALVGAISPLVFAADPPAAAPATPAAPAGGAGGGGGRGGQFQSPEERIKAMKEALTLTDDQSAKILAILQKDQEKIKPLRDDTSLSQEDRRAKMREIRQASQEEINKILTPDQQTKWKEEQAKRRPARAGQ